MFVETIRWFLERAAEYSFSAFASWGNFTAAIGVVRGTFTDLTSGLAWPYLLASLMISGAAFIFSRRNDAVPASSFRAFLFPRHVYRHPSAILDYRFYIVSTLLKAVLWVPILTGIGLLGQKMMKAFLIGYATWEPPTTLPLAYLFGAVLGFYLLHDFINYCAHVLLHKVPLLWSFHQVHHSAEVHDSHHGASSAPDGIFRHGDPASSGRRTGLCLLSGHFGTRVGGDRDLRYQHCVVHVWAVGISFAAFSSPDLRTVLC